MARTVLIYGVALASLVAVLKYVEYRYFIRDFSLELYAGLLAVLFSGLGIWIGFKLFRKNLPEIQPEQNGYSKPYNRELVKKLGISERELDVLDLLAKGHSNQEIARKLFVSLNTVKTHTSNLYSKLDVKRRTQAVQKARNLKLLA